MLVGRETEKQLVEGLIGDARVGRSASIALVGEVGIGKSALLDHAAAAADGMTVLRARGIQSEAHIPFAGLLELLRPVLGHLAQLADPQRDALEAALALRPSGGYDRFAIGAATLSLLAASADACPVLVLVDDAQWIDGSSADALLFAVRRLLADPIGVVICVRDGSPSLVDGTDLRVHRLGGLDRAASAELVSWRVGADVLVPDEVIDRLHAGTGGNPLALLELAADPGVVAPGSRPPLGSPLPVATRIANVYLERCAQMTGRQQDVLLLAAASDTTAM